MKQRLVKTKKTEIDTLLRNNSIRNNNKWAKFKIDKKNAQMKYYLKKLKINTIKKFILSIIVWFILKKAKKRVVHARSGRTICLVLKLNLMRALKRSACKNLYDKHLRLVKQALNFKYVVDNKHIQSS